MSFLKKLFSSEDEKTLKKYQEKVQIINSFEEVISKLSDNELKQKTKEFRDRLSKGETLDDLLPEAFAVVREASKRVSGERHYDVQLIGGMIIHDGNISEMRTGEGKTLVATLPAYLNALEEKGVHVVTVNDYLSQRDAVWMGQVYNALGLTVGVIAQQASYIYDPNHQELDKERDEEGSYKVVHEFLRSVGRPEAYQADITYGTNSEFGFDYLRDNIEYEKERIRQLRHNFAIVDEIDSILIDEARTPLIISMPSADSENLYATFAKIAETLQEENDYTVDEKSKSVHLTDSGIEKAEKALGVDNIYTEKGIKYVYHLETATRAKALFKKDREYVVNNNGEVIIVDESTGRLQPGRRWSEGLHQAIEAKEGVAIQQEQRTFASITYQNYFRMYDKLSGMTGTAKTSKEEFYKVYGLDVIEVPTNRPIARIDENDQIFQTEQGKFKAIARRVKELNEKGQPVLIGTASIEKNELLSAFLRQEGVVHEVLNAKNHEREGEIIAEAGRKGCVTIATNMAGRGVDIKLGGVPFEQEKYEEVKSLGGLFVLGTERHEARRIDNQLRGRAGRQGDPGTTQFFVSLEDTLMRVFASDAIKSMMGRFGIPEDQPIEAKLISRSLENAQTKIEGLHFDVRKHVLEFDNVLNTQRSTVYGRRRALLLGDNDDIKNELEKLKQIDSNVEAIIKEKTDLIGEEEFYKIAKRLILQTIDSFWVDHLEHMNYIRSSVSLRAYGQRDPLIEYQKEGKRAYDEMLEAIDNHIIRLMPNIGAGAFAAEEQKLKETARKAQLVTDQSKGTNSKSAPVKSEEKFGRNDMVTIEKDGEVKEMKFKKAEQLLKEGWNIKNN